MKGYGFSINVQGKCVAIRDTATYIVYFPLILLLRELHQEKEKENRQNYETVNGFPSASCLPEIRQG
jgi:hypothetical protein